MSYLFSRPSWRLPVPGLVQGQVLEPASQQNRDFARALTMSIPTTAAQRAISVTVRPGLASNAGLPDDLRLARTAMLAGEEISPDALRALADRWDGLAAQKYVRYLLVNVPENTSDIAYYGTVAASTGRVWSLPDAIAAMHYLDPETEPVDRKRAYIAMLYPHAWAGNPLALDAVIDLNGEGRLFGPLSEETRVRILEQDAVNGDGRAAMRMALALLAQDTISPEERSLAQDYLQRAAASGNFAVMVTANNLLAQMNPAATGSVPTQ